MHRMFDAALLKTCVSPRSDIMRLFTLDNILLLTDSYKISHWRQYPPGTEKVFAFFESRGGDSSTMTFFGLQAIIRQYLEGVVVTEEKIETAKRILRMHFGSDTIFNEEGWRYILNVHGGRLPVRICAVPEGTTVPVHNVLMTIENTDPNCPWIAEYLETLLSHVWYSSTVCTRSRNMRATILAALEQSGDPSLIDFKLHDFGCRGVSSMETAAIGGAAHLVNFKGTDTLPGLTLAAAVYHEECAGYSIPAAEHSTITAWGREHEVDAFANMLDVYPSGPVAVPSDSYDIFAACEELWGEHLRQQVLDRDGVLVVRPDSGPPAETVVRVLDILGKPFGYTVNAKGYKVLDPHVRAIQGDGVDELSLGMILNAIMAAGWSADNVAFGSGGGLLQKMNRDTQKCAIKASAVCIDGVWHDVFKDPITDSGKRSKRGRLALVREGGAYQTIREEELGDRLNVLEVVFENGVLLRDQTFAEIRTLAAVA